MGFFSRESFKCPECGATYPTMDQAIRCKKCANSRNRTTTFHGYGGKPKLTKYDARTSGHRPGHTKPCPVCRGRLYNAGGTCSECGGTGKVSF